MSKLFEKFMNKMGWHRIDNEMIQQWMNELPEEWITDYVDQQIQHEVSYQNDAQWWDEYSKTTAHVETVTNVPLNSIDNGWGLPV